MYRTTKIMLNDCKEQILNALKYSKIAVGENENGYIYEVVTKEAVIERVMEIYDYIAIQLEELRISGVVLNNLLYEYCPDLDKKEFFNDYIREVELEKTKDPYMTEKDKQTQKEIRKESFQVINGKKE